ncbi:MAG: hypothetical protein ABIA91_00345 [Patescibacteria group bacterium]
MIWINFLHFYQPPTNPKEDINRVVEQSYQPLVDFLKQHKDTKVTINISACLTEKLFSLGHTKLLKDFSDLEKKQQIEFVESAAFHSILPLLPEKEIKKQIKINNEINSKRFGKEYNPKGFYLPEMAYSLKVANIIEGMGYKYIILDEIAINKDLKKKIDNNIKYVLKNGLQVVFRNRKISQTFVPKTINKPDQEKIIITATDAELYGHRYWNWWSTYSSLSKKIQTKTISEYLKTLKEKKTVQPVKCSWESTPKELKKNIPFALWNNPRNKIHSSLWRFTDFVLKLNYANQEDKNHFASRLHLENGLASCTFWWASKKDFKLFSPVAWNPHMIEKGAHELLYSVRSLENIDLKLKIKAEKMFSQIRNMVWNKHWK